MEAEQPVPIVPFSCDLPVEFPLPPLGRGGAGAPPVTEEDMGKNDPDNIKYINVQLGHIPEGQEGAMRKIGDMVDSTHLWLDIHAGIQTRKQLDAKGLPNDDNADSKIKRCNYRAKVIDYILTQGNCTWLRYVKNEAVATQFTVTKATFHVELIRKLLQGITNVAGLSAELEGIVSGFNDIVLQTKNGKEDRWTWVFMNMFVWDDATKQVKGLVRIFSYRFTGEMVQYTINKASIDHVNMSFDCVRNEYLTVSDRWASIQADVNDFIDDYGKKKIRDPLDGGMIPV